MTESDKHPFKYIYLQYDPTGHESTWCQDKINDDDFTYVAVTELEKANKEIEQLKEKINEHI